MAQFLYKRICQKNTYKHCWNPPWFPCQCCCSDSWGWGLGHPLPLQTLHCLCNSLLKVGWVLPAPSLLLQSLPLGCCCNNPHGCTQPALQVVPKTPLYQPSKAVQGLLQNYLNIIVTALKTVAVTSLLYLLYQPLQLLLDTCNSSLSCPETILKFVAEANLYQPTKLVLPDLVPLRQSSRMVQHPCCCSLPLDRAF